MQESTGNDFGDTDELIFEAGLNLADAPFFIDVIAENVVNEFERLQITLMRPRFVTELFCFMSLFLQSLPKHLCLPLVYVCSWRNLGGLFSWFKGSQLRFLSTINTGESLHNFR